ncbi:MAG TPA: response regulator [Gammaproteobacteria bacterium]
MSRKRILIVDDDPTTASVIKLYINDLGYEIAGTANDGKEAINQVRSLNPDLVLMDINLGKGLDGVDTAEIMAKNFKTPIIFVTSHADEATLTRAKSVEPLGFINKPLRETDLKTTIEFAIAKIDSTGDEEEEKPTGSVEDVLIGLYSLTPAEARVTAKLLEVPELSYVSEALNISLSTAKTHLKRIYRKTNTNKQSLLVHKIVTGPAGAFMNKNPNSD